METTKKILDSAFRKLSRISVREGDVELMAAAKQELREAYARLDKLSREAADGQEN